VPAGVAPENRWVLVPDEVALLATSRGALPGVEAAGLVGLGPHRPAT